MIQAMSSVFGVGLYLGAAVFPLFDPAAPQSMKTLSALALYWGASAAVQSLPAPDASSGKLYRFAYTFANVLGANLLHAKMTAPSAQLLEHITPATDAKEVSK